jgi:hypothetical protein
MPPRPNLNAPSSPNPYRHHPDDAQNNPNGLIPVTRTESTLAPQALTPSHARELQSIRQLPPGTIVFSCGEASTPALDQNSGQNRLLGLLRNNPKNS